jgi:hypothetical protein
MDTTTFLPPGSALDLAIARLVRSRLAIGGAALGVIAAAVLWQWSWLVAIGVAPLLLAMAPCAAMCGLGLCMHRISRGSCASTTSPSPAAQADPGQIENSLIAQSTKET